ncbi:glycosyltransferase [uncultured Chitinophaga sp.]|uniref:glycosyltransferase family 2 protein n=1 Tax=uncultured Chitinophaga sp. TaxID=339340 RepID=UPI0025EB52A8|nr:glycosyltransferase [uncultured Chitinophaga sp.]
MNKDPLVTIVLPFYNNKSTLLLAVKSVICQTYPNWELILLDDGSVDGSLEIAKSLESANIQVRSDGLNKGLIARLNQMASLGSGEFLARMDADDLMQPTRIEEQMKMFKAQPELDLVDTGTYSIDEMGNPVGIRGLGPINYEPKAVLKSAMLLHASVIGKRSWFNRNPYDPDYVRAEDYELWCRTFRHSKFGRVPKPLYIVREGRVNIKNYERSSETIRKIMRKYGVGVFSPLELQIELLKSHLKVLLYRIFGAFNQHGYLSKKRNNPLSNTEREELGGLMRTIEAANI